MRPSISQRDGDGRARTAGDGGQQGAAQGVRQGLVDVHLDELADQAGIAAAEVDDAVVLGATLQHAGIALGEIADQDGLDAAGHAPADLEALLVDARLQDLQALLLELVGGVVDQIGRRGAGAGAVDEGEGEVETDVLDQLHGLFEVFLGLAGEADDEVRADADVGYRRLEPADARLVFQRRVVALHGRQDAIRTGLHRQVDEFH